MESEHLKTTKEGHVGYIVIGDFPTDDAEMANLTYDLTCICTELVSEDEIRVIVLTVSGDDSFVIGEEKDEAALEISEEIQEYFRDMTVKIADLDRPVIACITGNAIGRNLELVLACDIRIAQKESQFGLPHIKRNLLPSAGGTQRLLRVIGKGKALEMVLTGELIDAEEAHQIGLVDRVVAPSELIKVIKDMAHEMGCRSPAPLSYIKEAIHKGMDLTLYQGLRLEADLYYLIHTTRDREEGIRAFQDKREAKFEGE